MIRVVICDDCELFREVLCQSVERYGDLDVVASVGTVAEAIDRIESEHPDVALVDVRVGSESGIAVARWCSANRTDCAVVMMTAYDSDLALADSYAASAAGFVLKDISCARLVGRVRTFRGRSCGGYGSAVRPCRTVRSGTTAAGGQPDGRTVLQYDHAGRYGP